MADKQPSEMTDEELAEKVNPTEAPPEVSDEPEVPQAEVEEPTPEPEPEAPEPATLEPEAPQENGEEQAPAPPSNRLLTRAQKLLEKYGPPQPQQRPTSRPQTPQDALDYSQALDADPEVIKQLEADRQRTGDYQYNEGLRRAEAIEFKNNIRFDLPLVTEKLQKLDPRDAESLDKEYLYTVGFDPATGYVQNSNIGYAEFIEARIEQAERLAQSMNATTVKNIAKQTAQTGLRPDGSSAKRLNLNQAPQDMSLDELYAASGLPDTRPQK